MKRSALLVIAARTALGLALASSASGPANEKDASIYGVTLPPGYCDWRLIWVTHEEGDFNQLRVQLGNDVAIKAHREGKPPFPDGTIIVVLDWERVPSEEERVWPRSGFAAKKYAATGGWGFG